jgi:acetyl-CoA carboxylase carboxyltransferase component
MMDIINRLVDNSEFEAYKDGYGQTIITVMRIDGWAVGIAANQRKVKPRKAKCNLRCYLPDSADKATRFIANCNQKKIPFSLCSRCYRFMVGSKSEKAESYWRWKW